MDYRSKSEVKKSKTVLLGYREMYSEIPFGTKVNLGANEYK